MTVREKKAFLKSYGQTEKMVEQLRQEYKNSYSRAVFKSPAAQNERGGDSPGGTQPERAAEIADKFDKLIARELEKLYSLRKKIERSINGLSDAREQTLLRALYIGVWKDGKLRRKTLSEVADSMGYSLRQASRIHGSALKNLKIK